MYIFADYILTAIPGITSLTRLSSTTKDLFTYFYDLSPLDMDVLVILTKNNRPMTLEELGKESNRDKTTVFRSTQKLVRLGICNKETKSLKEGGQYHIYSAIPIDIFKKETEKKINELEQSLRRILRRFEKDMQDMISAFYSIPPPSKVS